MTRLGQKILKKGLVFYSTPWDSMQLGGRYGLKHVDKERHGDIKTGGIKLCKKREMMVFKSEKRALVCDITKSNGNAIPK